MKGAQGTVVSQPPILTPRAAAHFPACDEKCAASRAGVRRLVKTPFPGCLRRFGSLVPKLRLRDAVVPPKLRFATHGSGSCARAKQSFADRCAPKPRPGNEMQNVFFITKVASTWTLPVGFRGREISG